MIEISLKGREYLELCKLLKVARLCESGGLAKMLIADGLIFVDGEVETRKRCKIRSGQIIEFDGEKVRVTD